MAFDVDDERAPALTVKDEGSAEEAVLCAACRHPLCGKRAALEVQGRFAHVFMNPTGLVFHVHCYKRADGAAAAGAPTDEYSWFPGYAWSYALCGGCGTHLGWFFSGITEEDTEGGFWGLIEEQLIEP